MKKKKLYNHNTDGTMLLDLVQAMFASESTLCVMLIKDGPFVQSGSRV